VLAIYTQQPTIQNASYSNAATAYPNANYSRAATDYPIAKHSHAATG